MNFLDKKFLWAWLLVILHLSLLQAQESRWTGSSRFVLTGYGASNYFYSDENAGGNSFGLNFNPIVLYQVGDNLLFEGELEFEFEEELMTNVEYAQANWIVNDYVTLVAGKWLSPFGTFVEKIHPAWVNKLPVNPFVLGHHGLVPFTQVGIQLRGGIPLGGLSRLTYAGYVSNGVKIDTLAEEGFPDNFEDNNKKKGLGGRIGVIPIKELEVGGSVFNSAYDDSGKLNLTLWGSDVEFHYDLFDFRGEWISSRKKELDSLGNLEDKKEQGLYAQASAKLSFIPNSFFNRWEAVVRYDRFNAVEDAEDLSQYTFGFNYLIFDSAFLRFAYQINDEKKGFEKTNNQWLGQIAIGF